jgi:hypothetical protein
VAEQDRWFDELIAIGGADVVREVIAADVDSHVALAHGVLDAIEERQGRPVAEATAERLLAEAETRDETRGSLHAAAGEPPLWRQVLGESAADGMMEAIAPTADETPEWVAAVGGERVAEEMTKPPEDVPEWRAVLGEAAAAGSIAEIG